MAQNEHQLQAEIVTWWRNEHPERRGSLWGTFAEQNIQQAQFKRALGLERGLADLMMCDSQGRLIGMELKYPDTRHSSAHLLEQAHWLLTIPYKGYFVDSLDMAKGILLGTGEGIDPHKIIEYIRTTNKKSVLWQFDLYGGGSSRP